MNTIFKHGIFAIMTIAMVCGLCSCNDNDTEQKATSTISKAYCYVIDKTTGEVTHAKDLTYVMDFNYTKLTADITISNLVLPNGESYGDFKIENIPFGYELKDSSYWEVCSTNNATVTGNYGTPSISSFTLKLLDRTNSSTNEYVPGFYVSFTSGNYIIQSAYAPFFLVGTTVSSAPGVDSYTSETTTYTVTLNHEAKTANIAINNARFHVRMPEGLNMDFKDIPFSYMSDGTIYLSADEVIPYINNVPYNEQYPISNLTATVSPTDGMDLQFTCTFNNVPFSVKADVAY
jgi:hypothetical protein